MGDRSEREDNKIKPAPLGASFHTRVHGPAVAHCVGDRVDAIVNCLLPDGTRGTVCWSMPERGQTEHRWRRPLPDGSWRIGEIQVQPDDVVFVDGPEHSRPDGRGAWAKDERGMTVWRGPWHRAEAHGPAIVEYLQNDHAHRVLECLLPDGSRGTVLREVGSRNDPASRWRRPLADGSWRSGQVEISDDDVRFVEDPPSPPRMIGLRSPEEAPDLADDLMASERIAELVRDQLFAEDLYRALCNVRWFRNGHEDGFSFRSAGGVVAELRDLNEDYVAFYGVGNEGTVTNEVATELAALGWTWKPYD